MNWIHDFLSGRPSCPVFKSFIGHFRILCLLALVAAATSSSGLRAQSTSGTLRQIMNINQSWTFYLGDFPGAQVTNFNDSNWSAVNLPHSFSLPYFQWTQFYSGYGWYRRHIIAPPSWTGQRVFIEFDGAFQDAQIYVNGALIGEHMGGYSGFSYDITNSMVTGDNVIAVRLNNLWNAQLAPRSGEHTFSGGIYRDVRIVVTNPLHVTWYGTFVTTPVVSSTSATVAIQTEVANNNATTTPFTLRTQIVDPTGATVASVSATETLAPGVTGTFNQTTNPILTPYLWHPTHPYLYQAVTTLLTGGTAVDNYITTFGIRSIQWTAEQGFFINGAHYYIYGADVHQDHAGWGDGVTDYAMYRDVSMVKTAGFNFIRGSHYPKAPAFAAACDQLGVMLWSENCFWGIGGGGTAEGSWSTAGSYPPNAADQAPFEQSVLNSLTAMIRVHRNHPSIVAWSMCNEPFFTASSTISNMSALLAKEVALCHQLDPTRLAGIGGCQRPEGTTRIDKIGDIAGYNGDGATISEFQDPGIPNLVTEYGSVTATRPGNYSPGWGNLSGVNGQPVYAWRSGQCLWCAFDHGSIAGLTLGQMGIVDYFRLQKQAYYWYRANYGGIPAPPVPVTGTAAQLGLTADKTTLGAVDGTDDCQLIASVLSLSGSLLANTAPITLTILSGPGEFPTGRSITFTPPGSGAASDIAMLEGQAAIEFRAYQSGTSVIQATSPGLTPASITITSSGSPAFVPGVTPLVAARPYSRYSGTIINTNTLTLALNRPTAASSTAPSTSAGFANDGNTSTTWQAADNNQNAWWQVFLENSYQVDRVQIVFPSAANYQYKIEVSADGVNWTTAVDQSTTTSTEVSRTATGNFGSGISYLRVQFTGLPPGQSAALAEVSVGGGNGLTFNSGQLGGTIIGTDGSYANTASSTKEFAMDGDVTTYFDGPDTSGDWVGLDLGSHASSRITSVSYCPRASFASRMVGGLFQGANKPDFSDAVTLFTIAAAPSYSTYTAQPISNTNYFQYLRYLGPASGSCDVAELQFFGMSGLPGATTLYSFENNNAADSSGYGNNGTPTGVTYAPGKIGNFAASFNGSTSYIGSAMNASGDFSVAMWVKTTGSNSSGTSSSSWWSGKGLVDGYLNGPVADWGTSIVNGDFAFGIGSSATNSDVTVLSATAINTNTWHHVAATWAMANGAMSVYVDGTLSATGVAGAGVPRVAPLTLTLGRIASGTGYFSGALDDVRFYNRVLNASEISTLASGGAPAAVPGAPGNPTVATGDGQVSLAWSPGSGATSYVIQRSLTSGSGYSLIASVSGTTYTDTTVTDGATYYYQVSASNLDGASAYTVPVSATPLGLPGAPTSVVATSGSARVVLSWAPTATATSYSVLSGTTSGGPYSLVSGTLATPGLTNTGLIPGLTYFYVVTASNAAGVGAYSTEVSAIPLSTTIGGLEALPLGIVMTGTGANSNLAFTIQSSVTGHTYQLQYSATLITPTWTNVGSAQPGTGGNISINATVNPATAPSGFYRILIQ
jgi:hypothetical protein